MIAIIESHTITLTTVGSALAWGSNGSEKRMNPYVPIFKSTPARMTEPAVGASTCASGSQEWNGNMGTLMANPMAKAAKTQTCKANGQAFEWLIRSSKLNVVWPVSLAYRK